MGTGSDRALREENPSNSAQRMRNSSLNPQKEKENLSSFFSIPPSSYYTPKATL
jgi:hypothetical protein